MKIFTTQLLCVIWISALGTIAQAQNLADVDNFNKLSTLDSNTLHPSLAFWLNFNPELDSSKQMEIQQQVDNFCNAITAKRGKYKTDENYLWYVFNRIQNDFLQSYQPNIPFYKIFTSKTYNCVSGTALYALIFRQLGYKVLIRETADHAYLIIQLNKYRIMIESTDPQSGFITNQKTIYRKEQSLAPNSNRAFIQEISLLNLCGLQYYNQAVKFFYNHRYIEASHFLEKGMGFYPNSAKMWYLNRKIRSLQMAYSSTRD